MNEDDRGINFNDESFNAWKLEKYLCYLLMDYNER